MTDLCSIFLGSRTFGDAPTEREGCLHRVQDSVWPGAPLGRLPKRNGLAFKALRRDLLDEAWGCNGPFRLFGKEMSDMASHSLKFPYYSFKEPSR